MARVALAGLTDRVRWLFSQIQYAPVIKMASPPVRPLAFYEGRLRLVDRKQADWMRFRQGMCCFEHRFSRNTNWPFLPLH